MVYECGDLKYQDKLSLLKFAYLEERRIREYNTDFQVIKRNRYGWFLYILLKLSVDFTVTGPTYKIVNNSCRLDVRNNFFSNRDVDVWNELPQFVVDEESANSFKARFDKFYASGKIKC